MSIKERALKSKLWNDFNEKPTSFMIAAEKLIQIREGSFSQGFIDCVYQYSWHHKPDINDAYVFAIMYLEMFDLNNIAIFHIPVGRPPYPDKEITKNDSALKDLPAPFTGSFHGGTQDEDGYIKWDRPIHALTNREGGLCACLLPPMRIPLEVGTNSSAKFKIAFEMNYGIARWPYEHDHVTVFVNKRAATIYGGSEPDFNDILKQSGETMTEELLHSRNPFNLPLWSETSGKEISLLKHDDVTRYANRGMIGTNANKD